MKEQEAQGAANGDGVCTIKLRIGSRREFLDSVHMLSEQLIEEVGFPPDECYWMVTAVREAVTNAVIHGNKERPGTGVDLCFDLQRGCIRITVVDEGEGFDPDSLPDPVSKEHLLDASGRGVFLMKQLMDEVSYTFPESGGTILIMTKCIRNAAAAEGASEG
jgi:serine/threonine-protein kinase RsbW